MDLQKKISLICQTKSQGLCFANILLMILASKKTTQLRLNMNELAKVTLIQFIMQELSIVTSGLF